MERLLKGIFSLYLLKFNLASHLAILSPGSQVWPDPWLTSSRILKPYSWGPRPCPSISSLVKRCFIVLTVKWVHPFLFRRQFVLKSQKKLKNTSCIKKNLYTYEKFVFARIYPVRIKKPIKREGKNKKKYRIKKSPRAALVSAN